MSRRYEVVAGRTIFFDEVYFLAFVGQSRELPADKDKEYRRALTLPFAAQRAEMKRLGPEANPNLIPVKGLTLLEMIREKKMVPFFDQFFDQSRILQTTDRIVYEAMRAKSLASLAVQ